MKIAEALGKFIIQLEADGRAASTIGQYRRHVRLFSHWADEVRHSSKISEITHEDVAAFLASPQARTRRHGGMKKATSMNTLRTSLRCFFGYCHEGGFTSSNPGRLIRMAVCTTPPPRALTNDEIAKLTSVLKAAEGFEAKRDHLFVRLLLATGIRLGSAVALNVEDVDLDAGVLHLSITKRNQPDQVYLGKEIMKHLRRYLKGHPPGPLFATNCGSRLSSRQIQRRFTGWIDKAGIQRTASVHSLRHTMGSMLYRRTGDVFLVKEALRHRSIVSTLAYADADQNRLRQILQAEPAAMSR